MDYEHYYLPQLLYIFLGNLPYRDFTYNYPPLFIYTLYAFYLISHKVVALPIIIADAMSAPVIYLIVRTNLPSKIATAAAVVYIFSPYFLLYEGLTWLSEQPMLFFLLLSVYFLQKDKPTISALAFAISILMKQQALFLLPAYIIWALRTQTLKRTVLSFSLLVLVLVAISAPFLILTPNAYIADLTLQSTDLGVGPPLAFYLPSPSNLLPDLLVLALLVGAIIESFFITRRLSFTFSFAVSFATVTTPLFLLQALQPYKYYYAPIYALLLASSDDRVTLTIAAITPILILVASVYDTLLLPLVELNFFAIYWVFRNRRSLSSPASSTSSV